MKKKKILFVIPSFTLGGTIISLISLLGKIDYEKYEVDLYSRSFLGYDKICDKLSCCNILEENIWLSTTVRTKGTFLKLFSQLLQLLILTLRKLGYDLYPLCAKIGCRQINVNKYDVVIAYQESLAESVCNWKASRKIIWIHSDYERNRKINSPLAKSDYSYDKFDDIVCVSESAKKSFEKVFPSLKQKISVVYNIINQEYIHKCSECLISMHPNFDENVFNIISIGRIDPVKQFHLIPQIARIIKQKSNSAFKWYILGGGRGFESYELSIREDINSDSIKENVFFLGEITNVYPYIKKSNLLISLSCSETFALVVHEALALGVPVLMNDIPIAKEFFKDSNLNMVSTIDEMPFKILTYLRGGGEKANYINKDKDAIRAFDNLINR